MIGSRAQSFREPPAETELTAAWSPALVLSGAKLRLRAIRAWLARPPLWCTLVVCAVALVARRPDMVRSPQLWAEDGPIFFQQSRTLGAEALLQPSAGYLHTVLRLVAWSAAWFDPMLAPAIYVVASLLLTLYVAARTQSSRFPLQPSVGYALALVLVPDAFEVLLNLTNLQWVLALGLVLLLISREPRTLGERAHDIVASVLLGLTGPFVVPLAPLFLWRAQRRRTRLSVLLAVLAMVCAAIQARIILRNPIEHGTEPVAFNLLLAIPGVRIGGSLLGGGRLSPNAGLFLCSLCGAVTLVGVIALAWRRGTARTERVWIAAAFVSFLAVSLFRCRQVLPAVYYGAGSRYFFPLQLLGLWLLVAATTSASPRFARGALGLLALTVAVNLTRLREPPLADLQWSDYASLIRKGERTAVRINPDWEFTMPGRPGATPAAFAPHGPRTTLVNVSTRCLITPERPAMAGFVLHAGPPRRVLIRAVGPSLKKFGVPQPLAKPTFQLLQDGAPVPGFVATHNVSDDPALVQAAQSCAAFPLERGLADAAALVTLPAGTYSAVISSAGDETGEVLFEIYEIPGDGS
jgi:hypothetical protein